MNHEPLCSLEKTLVSFSDVFINTENKVHRVTKEADGIEIQQLKYFSKPNYDYGVPVVHC